MSEKHTLEQIQVYLDGVEARDDGSEFCKGSMAVVRGIRRIIKTEPEPVESTTYKGKSEGEARL